MAETVVLAGVNYTIPDAGDPPNWATGLVPYLVALAANIASNPSFMQFVNVAATPTGLVSGKTYLVTTSSLAITLNLPAPAQNAWFVIKDVSANASTRNVTIHRNGSEQIDGSSADKILSRSAGTWIIMSDGTNWWTINEFPDTGLVNSDIASAAAITYSKLSLTNSVVNADIASAAAIAYSKLNLGLSILNSDISASAAIALTKLAALGNNLPVITNGSGVLTTETALAIVRGGTNSFATLNNNRAIVSSGGALVEAAAMSATSLVGTDANGLPTTTGTNTMVTGQLLTGISATLGTITASDSILVAIGKIINARIIQIIPFTTTTTFSTTSASFQATNLTASITPKSSTNKVFVIAASPIYQQTGNAGGFVTLTRGGSNIAGTSGFQEQLASGASMSPCCIAYLDSPASTSALTYAVAIKSNGTNTLSFGDTNLTQTMYLIEIGA